MKKVISIFLRFAYYVLLSMCIITSLLFLIDFIKLLADIFIYNKSKFEILGINWNKYDGNVLNYILDIFVSFIIFTVSILFSMFMIKKNKFILSILFLTLIPVFLIGLIKFNFLVI